MGVQIQGDTGNVIATKGTYSGDVSIGGTLTYEDVTNIDSVGLVTARSGLEIGARPGVAASISVDGNMIVSGISTFGGDVQVPDKIIHSGDTNTAIRFPAADTVTVETGGSEIVRVNSDGNILINHDTARGVSGSASRRVQIEGTGSGSAIAIVRNSNNTSGAGLNLGKSRASSTGGTTIVQSGDKLGVISFAGADGTNLESTAAQISGEVDGTPGENDMPGRIVFKTTSDGSASPTERLRILSSGGITFNGDTATANALDDYEEGTWTPSIHNGGSPSYSQQSGLYTKIGNLVTHVFVIAYSGASSSNSTRIQGLPFAYNSTFETTTNLGRIGVAWNDAESAGNRACHAVGHTGSGTSMIYVDLLTSGTDKTLRGFFQMRVP